MAWESKEYKMFEYLQENYLPDLQQSGKQFSSFDCYSVEHKCEIELKYRHSHYDELLIEKIKYDKLMERAQDFGTEAVYVSATPKGIFGFNLSKIPEPEWFVKPMPKTTHFGEKQWVDKTVAVLSITKYAKKL